MRKLFVCIALVAAMVLAASGAQAQTLVYSFEDIVGDGYGGFGPDGYFGVGATVSQESVIGVTEGDYSLKYEIGNPGFVGARTETVVPAAFNDPPGVAYVLFDVTLPETYTGNWLDLGITIWGHAMNAPGGPIWGRQVQFGDFASVPLTAGTNKNLRVDLNSSVGPDYFGLSFNEIFGPGENDLTVASGFQIYASKPIGFPVTLYIDNVRLVVPEPATMGLVGIGLVAVLGVRRRSA